MERKQQENEKFSRPIKLPTINSKKGESSRVLTSTLSENPRIRPSSLHKVDDLEKKLFDKLDSYDHIQSKNMKKSTKKKSEAQNQGEKTTEGYERIQKLMPGLYSKLIEHKQGLETQNFVQSERNIEATKSLISQSPATAEENRSHKRRESSKRSIGMEQQEMILTPQQLNKAYRQYEAQQGLAPSTTKEELQIMNSNLLLCEKEIADLTQSMEKMITELGKACIIDFEEEKQQ